MRLALTCILAMALWAATPSPAAAGGETGNGRAPDVTPTVEPVPPTLAGPRG